MIYYFSIIFAIIFVIYVIMLVRSNKLDEKYSILWMVFSLLIIVLALWTSMLDKVWHFLVIHYAPAMLFLIGFIFVIFYIIHLSEVITKQNKSIVKLVQEIAILNKKIEEKENKEWNIY